MLREELFVKVRSATGRVPEFSFVPFGRYKPFCWHTDSKAETALDAPFCCAAVR